MPLRGFRVPFRSPRRMTRSAVLWPVFAGPSVLLPPIVYGLFFFFFFGNLVLFVGGSSDIRERERRLSSLHSFDPRVEQIKERNEQIKT